MKTEINISMTAKERDLLVAAAIAYQLACLRRANTLAATDAFKANELRDDARKLNAVETRLSDAQVQS